MKLYKATIKAKSNFATPLKGDTIFGQVCWYIKLLEGENKLKELLKDYEKEPFAIFSDAFISGYLPKPKLPSNMLGEDLKNKKENRKKIWLKIEDFFNGDFTKARTKDELPKDKEIGIVRNSINYKTFKTDGSDFAPYESLEFRFDKKDIYILAKEEYLEIVKNAFFVMGEDGFGKDKTIGKGRYEVVEFSEFKPLRSKSKYFMSISPLYLNGAECKNVYYDTFVRFGKLGMDRSNTNPFKKPLILGDSASVIELKNEQELPYVGKAIKNISIYEDVVHQGYSIVFAMEPKNE